MRQAPSVHRDVPYLNGPVTTARDEDVRVVVVPLNLVINTRFLEVNFFLIIFLPFTQLVTKLLLNTTNMQQHLGHNYKKQQHATINNNNMQLQTTTTCNYKQQQHATTNNNNLQLQTTTTCNYKQQQHATTTCNNNMQLQTTSTNNNNNMQLQTTTTTTTCVGQELGPSRGVQRDAAKWRHSNPTNPSTKLCCGRRKLPSFPPPLFQ